MYFVLSAVRDIVEIDISKDGDACDQQELNSLYHQPYYCSARKAVGLEKLYILHLDCQWQTNKLAAALSNSHIQVGLHLQLVYREKRQFCPILLVYIITI